MSARAQIIPVFVPHAGCPHDCVFCNQRRIAGQSERATAKTVIQALEQAAALPRGAKRQLAFYGGSFTAIPASEQEELLTAAQPYLSCGVIDSIRLSTRPDAIDQEVLSRLRRFRVETVELGAQSMDDSVLALAGRGHTSKAVEDASYMVRESGFELILQMMTGLPGDTDETAVETARRLIALRPAGVRIYPTVIVRDTVLYELWRAGRYREHTVEDAVRVCAWLVPLFESAGIPILRLGLNPTEELSSGGAVAGAYHPALGELVRSRVLLNRAEELLKDVRPGNHVTLGVNARELSQMIGQHRCNIDALCRTYALSALSVRPAEVKRSEVCLLALEGSDQAAENAENYTNHRQMTHDKREIVW